jgi:hypothetical protein
MKRPHLILALNLILVAALVYLTIGAISLVRVGAEGSNGWLVFSPVGTMTGMVPLIWLLIVFAADSIWLFFFITWILRRKLHIKGRDNTLRLP